MNEGTIVEHDSSRPSSLTSSHVSDVAAPYHRYSIAQQKATLNDRILGQFMTPIRIRSSSLKLHEGGKEEDGSASYSHSQLS